MHGPGDGASHIECTYEEPDPSTCTACDVELTVMRSSNPEGRIGECTDIPTHTCTSRRWCLSVECTYEEPDPSTCTACDGEVTGNVLTSNPEGSY